ncbi:hypothetical protein [Sphingobium sp. CECT 9361]|uniref:hypothetical protein n=1 Tax=Sphingobium sp. CECT 9361 TaxID=2845384 RepID=UPI001E64D4E0|nr:hypothetical protein [Sphingobium sp. CECT 9361]
MHSTTPSEGRSLRLPKIGVATGRVIDADQSVTLRARQRVNKLPHTIGWPTDNAAATPRTIPGASSATSCSHGPRPSKARRETAIAGAFVRTLKRGYAQVILRPGVAGVIGRLPAWLDHCNRGHSHRALAYRALREFIERSIGENLSGL